MTLQIPVHACRDIERDGDLTTIAQVHKHDVSERVASFSGPDECPLLTYNSRVEYYRSFASASVKGKRTHSLANMVELRFRAWI